ncbi:MAG: restriction endonuclease [Alphaproteobacteria bacterium]|nr:restriction endonuclease [Alphaproteobacteria bacterium]
MLPALLEIEKIRERLQIIFPEGTPERSKCTGLAAARTIFTMLYVGAIEGGVWLSPNFVYRMGQSQARKTSDKSRLAYLDAVQKPGTPEPKDRWYKENTRESIRDEVLRNGLVAIGAVLTNPEVPTTSSKGRYTLRSDLAELFDPKLSAETFLETAENWRKRHLTANALATVQILRIAAAGAKTKVSVKLPNGEARVLSPGLSSIITKAVVEVFGTMFLVNPAVLWISESGNKVVEENDQFLKKLGIKIEPEKVLPDVILADTSEGRTHFIFVEVVSSDGPIHETRRRDLLKLATLAGYSPEQVLFVTAFQSRSHHAFKKTIASLAWGSFAWCFAEPDHIIAFDGTVAGAPRKLCEFI